MVKTNTDALVVVVDDDVPVQQAYSRILLDAGINSLLAASKAELESHYVSGLLAGRSVCVLLDMNLGDEVGLDIQNWLTATVPSARVVYISGDASNRQVVESFRRGAKDFLLKPITGEELLASVRLVLELEPERSPELPLAFSNLSARESQVLRAVVDGKRSREIALGLGVTERTIKMHRTNIMRKLGVQSVAQLVSLFYQRQGDQPARPAD